ncbi:MAG: succinylglutamate desuccinylase/aspartoacylase family protein [Gammaproteobacteria bacterium]|nr:succinylglutamate desuccinylase/aspartoacylase family protein [Gammaproteobacteria bacterium]
MKNTSIQIGNETIHPGENLSLALPLPELFSCAPLYMPIKVLHGKQAGPCLLVTAAMHGNELNGTEIINRLMEVKSLKKLRGTLIAIPVLNVYGLMNRTRLLPGGIDLDRCFPGSKTGTHAARVADIFVREIFSKADICLDLQTGFINYSNLPQIYVNFQDEQAKSLAEAFNAPVISNAPCEKGMLRTLAYKQKKPFLTYEAGEAMRFDEHAIKVGLKGINNLLKKLHMLPEKKPKETKLKNFFADKNIWVRASTSGISHTSYRLGQHVKKDEKLCVIKDPFGATESATIKSPAEGIIVGKNNLPLVHEGEGLFQLAVFPKMQHAATHLEGWKEKSVERFEKANGDKQ